VYMPAGTRSTLRFLTLPSLRDTVSRMVLPFVALNATEGVRDRGSLIDEVLVWRDSPVGRRVMEGLAQMQEVVRTVRSEREQKRYLKEVQRALEDPVPWAFRIALDVVRLSKAARKGSMDTDAPEHLAVLSTDSSYRWLWSIREPKLQLEWQKRVRELASR